VVDDFNQMKKNFLRAALVLLWFAHMAQNMIAACLLALGWFLMRPACRKEFARKTAVAAGLIDEGDEKPESSRWVYE
jgi:hypothetical protein